MEGLILFGDVYRNKKVLVTGHTGFKGSWLTFWLTNMGAKVIGYSLEPESTPNHFNLLDGECTSVIGDIRDEEKLNATFKEYKPDIVFHLAAQALVRYSYENPIETYQTNVIGTLNVFEAARKTNSVRAIVNVTSDKCYDNKEWIWGYRENDPMGGYDPYSSSKGCSELLTSSYQRSFFNSGEKLLASVRAGNVIGGGDWAIDRLIPDLVKAANNSEQVFIRSPYATRPWQHVLEPLSGYLSVGWKLLVGDKKYASGWNFGPDLDNNVSVLEICKSVKKIWGQLTYRVNENLADYHEANLLMLDCSKAVKLLKWKPVWCIDQTLCKTIEWYKAYYQAGVINTKDDLNSYVINAKEKALQWVKET